MRLVDDLIARYAGGAGSGQAREPATSAASSTTRPSGDATAHDLQRRQVPPGRPVARYGQPELSAAGHASPTAAEANVPEVKIDFPGMLRRSGLSDEEQGRIEKDAQRCLHTLPAETPIEIKRQIVGASLSGVRLLRSTRLSSPPRCI